MRDFVKTPPARMRDILQSSGVESQIVELAVDSKIKRNHYTS